MSSQIPNSLKGRLLGDNAQISAAIDLEADTMKAMFLTSTHITDIDADVFIDDISTNEISATGSYSAGGITLTTTASTDDTNNLGALDATDYSVTSATIADVQYLATYKDSGTPSTSPIVVIHDLGGVKSCSNGTFSVTVHADGLITLA